MANELTYQSIFQGEQIDARLTAVASLQEALAAVEQAITAKYTKPASGIPETDLDADVQSALAKARSAVQDLSNYYTKTEIDALLSAVNSQQYVDVTALPTASADTLGKIYLVGPDTNNQYARYYTSYDGSAYSWVAAGTTEINLANYATKAELNQLSQEVTADISQLEAELYGVQPVTITDFSNYAVINRFVNSGGIWATGSSCLVPFSEYRNRKISIRANALGNAVIAFVKGENVVTTVPPSLCDGETGSFGVTTNGVYTRYVPNDCDWAVVASTIGGGDRLPISIYIDGTDGISDSAELLMGKTIMVNNNPVYLDNYVANLQVNNFGVISASSAKSHRIYYKEIDADTTLSIIINTASASPDARGIFGYVDSISDIVAGGIFKQTGNINFDSNETKIFRYDVPAGKIFCVFKRVSDPIAIHEIDKEIKANIPSKNIIDGSYSWWTSPHADRKVIGRNDYTIAAYQKSTGELCVSIRDNNKGVCKEAFLMMGFEVDDHNGPACAFLPDGRIIVTCAKGHHATPNQYIFISDSPFSIDSFTEKVFQTTGACTYSRLIIQNGYIFIFWREEIEGISYWHGVYSTDEFATNSGEFDFIRQSYVYLEKTTDPDYIKIYPCGHPAENAVELNAIRSGYIKLSTMDILKGDGVTKVADLGTFVDNTDFDIIIDATTTSKNRMLDAAITPVGVDRFVYSKGNPSSTPYDAKYYYYDNGTIIEIAPTGEPFYTASKYVGGAIIARQNNDVLIVARQDNGVWKLERYQIKNGAVVSVSLLDYSDAYILRPIECGGCQFIYQKGDYNPSSFMDFATNIIFKDIVS